MKTPHSFLYGIVITILTILFVILNRYDRSPPPITVYPKDLLREPTSFDETRVIVITKGCQLDAFGNLVYRIEASDCPTIIFNMRHKDFITVPEKIQGKCYLSDNPKSPIIIVDCVAVYP